MRLPFDSGNSAETAHGSGLPTRSASSLLRRLCWVLTFAVTLAAHAVDCVIVVDTSGSMRERISGKDNRIRIGVVQNALQEYLPALPKPSRVSLIAFNSGIVSEREFILRDAAAIPAALSWVDGLDGLTRSDGQTHLWTTLQRALEVATRYSRENPEQPVIVRALTDGQDNQGVTSLEKVLKQFPLVDGEHIRGNLVLLGDLELKTRLTLPEGAFTTTKSTAWADIFPPVVLWFPTDPRTGDEVRFVENTRSIYAEYEWLIDGQTAGREKVLVRRFTDARTHRVMLKVKGLQGHPDSSTVSVNVQPRESLTVEVTSTSSGTVEPGATVRFWVRPSAPAKRVAWFVNDEAAGSTGELAYRFDNEGVFEVKVVVWSADGRSATHSQPVSVKESPLAVQIKAPSLASAGQPVQFAAEISGPCARLQWRFGDGLTAADKDPVHTFAVADQAGTDFQVWLRAESPMGRVIEAGPHTLRVQEPQRIKPPVAAFGLVEQSIRAGVPLRLLDESQGYIETREWRVGGVRVSGEKNPVITLTEPGPTLLTLVVRGPGGTNEVSKDVSVFPRSVPVRVKVAASRMSGTTPLSVQFTNLSTGDMHKWLWIFGDGQTSTNASPVHVFTSATNHAVTVTGYPSDPKQSPAHAQIIISPTRPFPKWAKVAFPIGASAVLAGLATWLVIRRRRERLRLAVFWWPEQASVCRRADLNTADDHEDLKPDLPLRIRRIGKTANLLAETLDGACIVAGDGQEAKASSIGQGARLVIRTASGIQKAVAIAATRKPRRPSPAAAELVNPAPGTRLNPATTTSTGDINWG